MEETKSDLQLVQDTKYDQYMEAQARMKQVVDTMRDTPATLPQQVVTDDASVITHCVFPPTGGVLTYLARYEQPFRGFPLNETVQSMDDLKKLAKIIIQHFVPYIKKSSIISKFRLLLAAGHFRKLGECYILAYHWHVKRYRLKAGMYCQPVRELYRIVDASYEVIEDDELREATRDLLCMFLEFDNAYRYRFQDIVTEVDKKAIRKDTTKEIIRLIDLLIDREVRQEGKVSMADKWIMLRNVLKIVLKLMPSFRKVIRDMVMRVNLKEIEFSTEDRYYCEFRKDYKFGFMTRENIPIREVPKGSPIKVDQTIEIKQ